MKRKNLIFIRKWRELSFIAGTSFNFLQIADSEMSLFPKSWTEIFNAIYFM